MLALADRGSHAKFEVARSSVLPGQIRRLGPQDHAKVCAHLARLGADDFYARFSHPMNAVALNNFCRGVSWLRTFLLGYFVDDEVRALGELRLERYRKPDVAELALSVEAAFQNQGIGTELFRRQLLLARNRGLRGVWLQYRMDNLRLKHIAEKFGAKISVKQGEADGCLDLQSPGVLAQLGETEAGSEHGRLLMQLRSKKRKRRAPPC
jgi:GNAT superfamily N-acetyltransferase